LSPGCRKHILRFFSSHNANPRWFEVSRATFSPFTVTQKSLQLTKPSLHSVATHILAHTHFRIMFRRKSSASSLPTTMSPMTLPTGNEYNTDGSGKAIKMDAPVVKAWKQASSFTKYSYYILGVCIIVMFWGFQHLRYWNGRSILFLLYWPNHGTFLILCVLSISFFVLFLDQIFCCWWWWRCLKTSIYLAHLSRPGMHVGVDPSRIPYYHCRLCSYAITCRSSHKGRQTWKIFSSGR
jgi:hypothetical protein